MKGRHMKKHAKDELEEMFEELGELDLDLEIRLVPTARPKGRRHTGRRAA
jgi:hypothetical protein